jgi:DNA gyrase subunit A
VGTQLTGGSVGILAFLQGKFQRMSDFAKEIQKVNIEDEMKQSYLDYAMSVIVGRALPDVRDGLKPVHRRSLFAMNELGNVWNKPYKKSARIVGDILGKYHPHGDSAVYDTIVRMAQPFSLRYPLVDGQGNFGSIDADAPAAMRYTEIRMAKIAHELIADIDKETVDFVPNYDGTEHEPTVFPTRLPNLLINGTSGIAVGMATNIPPHNIKEVVSACIALIDNEDLSIEGLMHYIPGPDFPTAAIISGTEGIVDAYRTGRGRLYIRSRTTTEDLDHGKQQIIVTELPYQVNKARLIERIAELVKEKKLEGITEVRDESDKDGVRVVLELRRGEVADVIQNNLFQHTQLQIAFGINIVALVDGQPRTLNLKQLLEAFLRHRREVVTRRTLFDLRKARERTHILEGLAVALSNIDAIVALVKSAQNPSEAKQKLLAQPWNAALIAQLHETVETTVDSSRYQLSDIQVQAILELRLHRLTGLEQDKILSEYRELLKLIAELLDILSNPDRLMSVIRQELQTIYDTYGDPRRTEILFDHKNLRIEDLITAEAMVVTLSHAGYIKSQPLTAYTPQRRGGKGKTATQVKEEDFVDKLFIANTHDTILCFSTQGVVYWLKVYDLPQANRTARGKPIVNLLPLREGERISAILPVREFSEQHYVFMATAQGTVKKTALPDFSRPRSNGIIAIDLDEKDMLICADITDGQRDVMLFTREGNATRFQEDHVRAMGRTARGVRGIRLENEQDAVIALIVTRSHGTILTATENGYGKRTPVDDYAIKGRGGKGVITIKTSERNGKVISAIQVEEDDDVMLISNKGTLVRTRVSEISVVGRNTQGVGLIRLNEGEQLVGIARVVELDGVTADIEET